MTKEEIFEGNKLIAEFMSDFPKVGNKYAFEKYPSFFEESMLKDSGLSWIHKKHLSYHLSWDWLMSVIEKLKEKCEDPEDLDSLKDSLWWGSIEDVWKEVVNYLK